MSKHKFKLKLNKKVKLISISLIVLLAAGTVCYFTVGKDKVEKVVEKAKKKNTNKKTDQYSLNIVDIDSKTRPYAVMINNIAVARPLQCGLQDAYIIYEIIVEGGITRYLAVFSGDSDIDCIGSIRSARHYYLDYVLENDAIFVHNGYSPTAGEQFGPLGIDRISAEAPKTGVRERGLNVSREHTLFTSTALLKNGIGSKRTEYKDDRYADNYGLLLHYSDKALDLASIPNAQVANKVDIRYSNSTTTNYEYDAEAKVYKRSVNGKAHKDRKTKEQYTFKNIITYQVQDVALNDGGTKGRRDIKNIGEGTGYYISEGYAIPIKWKKDDRKNKTVYSLEDGTELKVNDGNTFIQIQPLNEKLTISE